MSATSGHVDGGTIEVHRAAAAQPRVHRSHLLKLVSTTVMSGWLNPEPARGSGPRVAAWRREFFRSFLSRNGVDKGVAHRQASAIAQPIAAEIKLRVNDMRSFEGDSVGSAYRRQWGGES
jgi:hypothetical protein